MLWRSSLNFVKKDKLLRIISLNIYLTLSVTERKLLKSGLQLITLKNVGGRANLELFCSTSLIRWTKLQKKLWMFLRPIESRVEEKNLHNTIVLSANTE